jgi:serine/threonine protein kinase
MGQVSRHSRQLFTPGDIIGSYTVLSLLGQGGYGDIYLARPMESDTLIALKIESFTAQKRALERELLFLEDLQDSSFFPRLIESGRTETHRFIVMELLGPSVSNVRRQLPGHCYTVPTVIRLALFMLACIRDFHRHGFVHRDIKPGNFLVRASAGHPLVLIDFGLSKSYIDPETGRRCPARPNPGFYGTPKYASAEAQVGMDQCPRDDLIALVYSMVELVEGRLPWSSDEDRLAYRKKKAISGRTLFRCLPCEIVDIAEYLGRLRYASKVNYDYVTCMLCQALRMAGIPTDCPFDWEALPPEALSKISAIPCLPRAVDCTGAIPRLGIEDEQNLEEDRCLFCVVA